MRANTPRFPTVAKTVKKSGLIAAARAGDDEEDDEDSLIGFSGFQETLSYTRSRFYLSGPIGLPQHYAPLVQALYSASPDDEIYIHLATPGGVATTGVQLINAINASAASVTAVLDGEACSMGAVLLLATPQKIIMPDATLMFHTYSGGPAGKASDQLAQVLSGVAWYEKLLRRYCQPFLSDDEVEAIMRGQDLWLGSDEITERFERIQAEQEAEDASEAEGSAGAAGAGR